MRYIPVTSSLLLPCYVPATSLLLPCVTSPLHTTFSQLSRNFLAAIFLRYFPAILPRYPRDTLAISPRYPRDISPAISPRYDDICIVATSPQYYHDIQ